MCVLHCEQLSTSSSTLLRMAGSAWKAGEALGFGNTQTDKPVPGRRTLVPWISMGQAEPESFSLLKTPTCAARR